MVKSSPLVLPVTDTEFSSLMAAFPHAKKIAVGVSGGGDSLALLWLLARWAMGAKIQVHALTVDHGLRKESAREAKQVAVWVKGWPNVTHTILKWRGKKPITRIMERAREARYALMAEYCRGHKIKYLYLAHQQDDQAETVLMRLLHGSGLDGLTGIRSMRKEAGGTLLRPLLNIPHIRLIATLKDAKQEWIEDPSNENPAYLRPRVRKMFKEEGLSAERLSQTAVRLSRVREALEVWENHLWDTVQKNKGVVYILCADWKMWPEEIRVRILSRSLDDVGGKKVSARLEQVEEAIGALALEKSVVRLTLQGCLVTRGAKFLKISREKA